MAALNRGDRREAGVHLRFRRFLVAGDLEFDQRRVTVGGDLTAAGRRRADFRHRGQLPQGAGRVVDRRLDGGFVDAAVLLCMSTTSLLGFSFAFSSATSARPASPETASASGQLALADGAADDDRDDHEGQPPEDGRLAMGRAPPGGAGCDVRLAMHWVPFAGIDATTPDSQRANPVPMRLAGVSEVRLASARWGVSRTPGPLAMQDNPVHADLRPDRRRPPELPAQREADARGRRLRGGRRGGGRRRGDRRSPRARPGPCPARRPAPGHRRLRGRRAPARLAARARRSSSPPPARAQTSARRSPAARPRASSPRAS